MKVTKRGFTQCPLNYVLPRTRNSTCLFGIAWQDNGPHPSVNAVRPTSNSSILLQDSRSFLFPLLLRCPELVAILHHIPEHCPTNEYQVFPPGRVLDIELELLEPVSVSLENVFEIPEALRNGW